MMNLAKVTQLFAYKALWSATGLHVAGRALIHALGSEDENLRAIAGMFLVQAGKRAEPLLEEALSEREHLPMILSILGSIGDPKVASELRPFIQDSNPEVAQAAREALRVIDLASQSDSSDLR